MNNTAEVSGDFLYYTDYRPLIKDMALSEWDIGSFGFSFKIESPTYFASGQVISQALNLTLINQEQE